MWSVIVTVIQEAAVHCSLCCGLDCPDLFSSLKLDVGTISATGSPLPGVVYILLLITLLVLLVIITHCGVLPVMAIMMWYIYFTSCLSE